MSNGGGQSNNNNNGTNVPKPHPASSSGQPLKKSEVPQPLKSSGPGMKTNNSIDPKSITERKK